MFESLICSWIFLGLSSHKTFFYDITQQRTAKYQLRTKILKAKFMFPKKVKIEIRNWNNSWKARTKLKDQFFVTWFDKMNKRRDVPEAQFPSAVPPLDEQVSVDWQVPNITLFVLAVDKTVHCLKLLRVWINCDSF